MLKFRWMVNMMEEKKAKVTKFINDQEVRFTAIVQILILAVAFKAALKKEFKKAAKAAKKRNKKK